ncbi:ABC transporter G family member 20 [Lamellibrachia satsuma]|nr:ABC transporter G family member 20 [Lamellibrachia satsuma]
MSQGTVTRSLLSYIMCTGAMAKRRNKLHVLRDLSMAVPTGFIYGLLGPSGCGKTTLLHCIVGSLMVDRGEVRTLGARPGQPGHEVPGCRVGYMPQELALYQSFTIGETLFYFGRIHKMKSEQIKSRLKFLCDFLRLPPEGRLVKQCSGGEQRRTSFAIALLQEPELLILDEPTVGVDPLLRQSIWDHMLEISQSRKTTIIITTHYVEEARQANMVGLMRDGRLLAESPPDDLLQVHNLQSLEDVFLRLCERDQLHDNGVSSATDHLQVGRCHDDDLVDLLTSGSSPQGSEEQLYKPYFSGSSWSACCSNLFPSPRNVAAIAIKNLVILARRLGFLIFEFLLPSIQIVLFCLCIGRQPYDLAIAVVNNETCVQPFSASCVYLGYINNHTIIQKDFGVNMSEAVLSVKQGLNWGVIEIGKNFTQDLIARMTTKTPDNATLAGSEIRLFLDMTNQQVALTVQKETTAAFERFLEAEMSKIGMNPELAEIPVKLELPIYGERDPSFTNFMAPGIILSITFFMATGLTALSFVLERKQGLLDRSFVAGVTAVEVMLGHMCSQFLVLLVQVSLLLVFILAVFQVPFQGPLILVILLTLMQGLTGMALGLLISSICETEMSAIQCALGSVYPNMLLSGIIWPIESMPLWLRYIGYCLPMTFAAEALRSILARGWDLTFMPVWRGFLMTLGWGSLLLVLSGIMLKVRVHA